MARDGSEGEKNRLTKLQILQDFSFFKKSRHISEHLSYEQGTGRNPPVPLLKL